MAWDVCDPIFLHRGGQFVVAHAGFPVLGSILARDGFAPRQLGSRGDRLAYSTASSSRPASPWS